MAELIGGLLLFVGIVLLLVGSVGFLVAAFRESVLWGLAVLLISPVWLAFLIVHWRSAKDWFFLQLYGVGAILVGVLCADGELPIPLL